MKRIFTTVIFLVTVSLSAKQFSHDNQQLASRPTSLTIEQATARALEYRPDLEALSYATEANKSGAKAEIAGYYPTIAAQSDLWQERGQCRPSNTTIVSANQLIYSFAGPIQRYKRAKKYADISKLDEAIQTNKIRLEVEKAFLQAWIFQEQQETINALKKSSKTTFTQAKHQEKLNLLDKNVWLKNAEDYASSLSNIEQYEDNTLTAYKRLEFLMGQPLILLDQTDGVRKATKLCWHYSPTKPVLKTLSAYYDLAIQNRPELEQARKKIDVERYNVKLAQGARLPTISAAAQAGFQSIVYQTPADDDYSFSRGYHNLQLTVKWSIFDGMVNQYQERQAYANKVKEILQQDQTVLDIKQEVQDKYYALSRALSRMQAQKSNYLRTNNEFQLRKQELEVGQISPVEFDSAKTAWEQAQLDWLTVNTAVETSKCELMYACGYPKTLQW